MKGNWADNKVRITYNKMTQNTRSSFLFYASGCEDERWMVLAIKVMLNGGLVLNFQRVCSTPQNLNIKVERLSPWTIYG